MKRWFRPDMTEKLLTDMLILNTNKIRILKSDQICPHPQFCLVRRKMRALLGAFQRKKIIHHFFRNVKKKKKKKKEKKKKKKERKKKKEKEKKIAYHAMVLL